MSARVESISLKADSGRKGAAAEPEPFKSAERIHEALTAKLERKALIFFAKHMPRSINSDHLTLLGFVAQFLAGASFALARWNKYSLLLACFFIAVNWFGDSLDGTLARVRNQQRPRYGFYVDHIIDAFGAIFLMCGLAFSGYLHWGVAMAMLIAFLLISIETYLATYTLDTFRLSHGIFGPTEIRILLIIGSVTLLRHPYTTLFGHRFLLFDIGGVIGTAGMVVIVIIASVRHTIELYRKERLS